MKKFTNYLAEQGFVSATKVVGPRGAFISAVKTDKSVSTFPIGKRSQNGTLQEYNVLLTDDGQAIATVNEYKSVQTISLVAEQVQELVA